MEVPGNLADTVRRNAQIAAKGVNRTAIVWRNHEYTWTETDELVDAYARGLRQLGLKPGNPHPARVAIAVPNRPEFVTVYFAVLRAGLIAVPLNPGYTGRELHELLTDSGASVLVATPNVLAALREQDATPSDLAHVYVVGDDSNSADPRAGERPIAALAMPGEPIAADTGGEDVAVLLYTSGTEGRPKGAMLSHRALLANHAQVAAIAPPPIGADDVVLLAVPLFHAYGLNSALGAVAYHGATGVLVDPSDATGALHAIRASGVTSLIGVPTMYSAWAQAAASEATNVDVFASVRVAVSGAAPLDVAVARRFEAVAGQAIQVGYGLTETAPVVTTTLASPVPKDGSIGRVLPGVDVRLIGAGGTQIWRSDAPASAAANDFDDDAAGSPGTDPGEISVRGANLFSGYWPDGRDAPDSDGWWATADVAYADADGDLFLVDRLRQLILVHGFNVYPAEVEQVLVMHPAVAEAAVVGVPHEPSGQTVKAYVVARSDVTAAELADHCAHNLARFKCPTEYEFVAELPHSVTGKVRRAALGDIAAAAVDG
ncbi:MAG TPA: AMP-binding protein [Micromonosporaceae bacterium]|nr:AMP-binding protein [Micromonosporaceae bacterium]